MWSRAQVKWVLLKWRYTSYIETGRKKKLQGLNVYVCSFQTGSKKKNPFIPILSKR